MVKIRDAADIIGVGIVVGGEISQLHGVELACEVAVIEVYDAGALDILRYGDEAVVA